ncbi:MAG: hypothetical protein SGARI_004049, partial [Bacillariaceae sp.]
MCVPGSSGSQEELFELIGGLESLKGLIISDGYIPRKDNGLLDTDSFLTNLPRARNLQYLDIQRLRLEEVSQVDLLAECLESMQESLEEIRITGITLGKSGVKKSSCNTAASATAGGGEVVTHASACFSLDNAIAVCVEMANLRSLA